MQRATSDATRNIGYTVQVYSIPTARHRRFKKEVTVLRSTIDATVTGSRNTGTGTQRSNKTATGYESESCGGGPESVRKGSSVFIEKG